MDVWDVNWINKCIHECLLDTDNDDDYMDSEKHMENDGIDWEDDDQVDTFMASLVYLKTVRELYFELYVQ